MSEQRNNFRRRWGLLSLLILAIIFPFAIIGKHTFNIYYILCLKYVRLLTHRVQCYICDTNAENKFQSS